MRLNKIDKYLNTAFDGDYFESSISWEILDKDNEYDEEFKCVYYGKTMYLPSDSSVLRIKRYSKIPYNADTRDEFTEDFIQMLINCIILSKETEENYVNGVDERVLMSFADYKKEILESKKNKINE